MLIVIPLRILTTISGIILGYTAGIYIEILYEKQHNYSKEVSALLTAAKYGYPYNDDNYSSGYDDNMSNLFMDFCANSTSDCDTEESE